MRPEDKEPVNLLETAGLSRPPKTFTLALDRVRQTRYKDELRSHEEAFVARECLQMPLLTTTLTKDPRDFPFSDMFRDAIRKALRFEALRVDFLWIAASLKPVRKLFDFSDNELHVPWAEFLRDLNTSSDNTIIFSYALRVVDDVEFEYGGPPLPIMDEIIRTHDNDVAQKPQSAVEVELHDNTREAREEMMMRLIKGGSFPAKKSIPESYFNTDNQKEMLEYHDGINVFTPQRLLEWQRTTIEQAVGKMTKRQPQSSIPLSANIRKEMKEIETEHENVLISSDVRYSHPQTGLGIALLTCYLSPIISILPDDF